MKQFKKCFPVICLLAIGFGVHNANANDGASSFPKKIVCDSALSNEYVITSLVLDLEQNLESYSVKVVQRGGPKQDPRYAAESEVSNTSYPIIEANQESMTLEKKFSGLESNRTALKVSGSNSVEIDFAKRTATVKTTYDKGLLGLRGAANSFFGAFSPQNALCDQETEYVNCR